MRKTTRAGSIATRRVKDVGFTPGEALFYGGIAGMVVVVLVTIIVIAILSGSRKRLRKKFNEEYGGKMR